MSDQKISIGTDIVEVKRFRQRQVNTSLNFYNSIFTKSELRYSLRYSDPYPHLAGIFAAKEAIVKCFDIPFRMSDIEVRRDVQGKPIGRAKYKGGFVKVKVSISHTRSIAIAVAIAIL